MFGGRIGSGEKQGLWQRIKRMAFTDDNAIMRGLNQEDLEQLERVLIEADFGVRATVEITEDLEDQVRRGTLKTEEDLRTALVTRLTGAALMNCGRAPTTVKMEVGLVMTPVSRAAGRPA